MSEDRVGKAATSGLGILRRGKTDPFRGPWKHPALKARLDIEFRGARVYITGRAKTESGNSSSVCLMRPGVDPNLILRADVAVLYRVWVGYVDYQDAVRRREIIVEGPRELARALPQWFMWSPMARFVRECQEPAKVSA